MRLHLLFVSSKLFALTQCEMHSGESLLFPKDILDTTALALLSLSIFLYLCFLRDTVNITWPSVPCLNVLTCTVKSKPNTM